MRAELLQGTIEKYKKIRHVRTQAQIRKHTKVGSPNTWAKYMDDPSLMPMGVFFDIMDYLKVPWEERVEILKS